ncbi:ADP-ribosylation factor-like protein 16 isoform X2 [Ornithorhynchus anatinus]|uniref:ADP-ribosylation factor-like protein 16 isoform X2 n=1 Tax=Ornithorhynchus anatinus TaxID=9258 RepID=UPI0010A91D48|nr:ADP-ribosylation factor-like protein 16 isoform X2 [Ornithorhynchus anatinus]
MNLTTSSQLTSGETKGDLGDPPPTQPTVGTNLTDLVVQRKMVVRELGGRMAPIWPSYYGSARAVMFVIDASDPTQLSSSCAQLLSVLSAEQLATAPVLVLFNKIDLPSYMTPEEMEGLLRLPDIIATAGRPVATARVSARDGTGLTQVLRWLRDARLAPSHRPS